MSMFRNVLINTIRKLQWHSIFTPPHNYKFLFRKAGGDDNASLHAENSRAVIDTIYGNTVKWNQLVGANTTSVTLVSGHKYYTKIGSTASIVTGTGSAVAVTGGSDIVIDLTALEYPNITTDTPTVAETESWLALNVGTQDYYPYDAGSLISFGGTALKSVGFNQFDESTLISGKYRNTFNAESQFANRRCSDEYYRCLPNTHYYLGTNRNAQQVGNFAVIICWYDYNKQFISGISGTNIEVTSPSNAAYFRISSAESWGTICINLSSDKNGTYEPYWEDVLPIDPTKVYGKVNGEGSSVQCFPNGMRSAGSVHDTLTASEAVVRIGSKDFSSMSIEISSYQSGAIVYFKSVNDAKINSLNFILSDKKYTPIANVLYIQNGQIHIGAESLAGANYKYSLVIYDSAFVSMTTSQIADMFANTKIQYELATPITYTDLIYSEDGGVTGTPLTAFKYKVDKYSTEEVLVPSGTVPTSTCINADIDYQYQGE